VSDDRHRRLADWMDGAACRQGRAARGRFLSGGTQNVIYEIRRGEQRCVLRMPPPTPARPRQGHPARVADHRGARRHRRAAHAAVGVVPDAVVLGRPFYLMGFVDGWSPMELDHGVAAPFDTDLDARGLGYQLAEGIALLSKVDWQAKGCRTSAGPTASTSARSTAGPASSSGSRAASSPASTSAAWLRAHKPLDFIPGLMHGDYQFANVMYRHGAPAQLAAIVDWEMGTVGDPKLDLGWMVQSWPRTPSARRRR
jgi:aminoglycoside phosphotransferase (APT) family kinase protein